MTQDNEPLPRPRFGYTIQHNRTIAFGTPLSLIELAGESVTAAGTFAARSRQIPVAHAM